MAVYSDIDHLPQFRNAVVTIGTFDGVHMGHKTILQCVTEQAATVEGESVLITFEPHPRKLLFPDQPLGILTPLADKLELLQAAGIMHAVVVPFTKEFAAMAAEEYVRDFLVKRFHPHSIVIGYDHRFGNDRKGDLKLLEDYRNEFDYNLVEIPPRLIDEAAVSSTKIRGAISSGQVQQAAVMLGRYYSVKGGVVHGNKLGRELGYPTANIEPADGEQLLPGNGIYAVYAIHKSIRYKGMMSIGYNPTVTDRKELRLEVNIFDFDLDIYNEMLEVQFVAKMRDELKFSSLDELKAQLALDREEAESIL